MVVENPREQECVHQSSETFVAYHAQCETKFQIKETWEERHIWVRKMDIQLSKRQQKLNSFTMFCQQQDSKAVLA